MDEEDKRRKKKKDFVYSRRRCLSRDNSYTSKDDWSLRCLLILASVDAVTGFRSIRQLPQGAAVRTNDHLIRERKKERTCIALRIDVT